MFEAVSTRTTLQRAVTSTEKKEFTSHFMKQLEILFKPLWVGGDIEANGLGTHFRRNGVSLSTYAVACCAKPDTCAVGRLALCPWLQTEEQHFLLWHSSPYRQ